MPLPSEESEKYDRAAAQAEQELKQGIKDGTIATAQDIFNWVAKWKDTATYKRLGKIMISLAK